MSSTMPGQLWDVDVEVMPKAGVNDPAGEAIHNGLGMLGYSEVQRVRSGKIVRLVLAAPDETMAAERAAAMANQLLANPVIEVFTVRIVGPAREMSPR